jgi:hypothetical protein
LSFYFSSLIFFNIFSIPQIFIPISFFLSFLVS